MRSHVFATLVALAAFLAVSRADSAIDNFVKKFTDATLANPAVAKAYDIVLIGGKKAGPIYEKVTHDFLVSHGRNEKEATKLGALARQIVENSYDKINPTIKAKDCGSLMANYLKDKGILNKANAAKMAANAAEDFDSVVKATDITSPEAKSLAIFNAFEKFFNRSGLSFATDALTILEDANKVFH